MTDKPSVVYGERLMLTEFLGQGLGHGNEFEVTIQNLTDMVTHVDSMPKGYIRTITRIHIKIALKALTKLHEIME